MEIEFVQGVRRSFGGRPSEEEGGKAISSCSLFHQSERSRIRKDKSQPGENSSDGPCCFIVQLWSTEVHYVSLSPIPTASSYAYP